MGMRKSIFLLTTSSVAIKVTSSFLSSGTMMITISSKYPAGWCSLSIHTVICRKPSTGSGLILTFLMLISRGWVWSSIRPEIPLQSLVSTQTAMVLR